MAVTSVVELWTGRNGEIGADLSRRYTRRFRVVTNDKTDGPGVVEFAAGIPLVGEWYVSYGLGESDLLATCQRVRSAQDDIDPTVWIVEAEYETPRAGQPSNFQLPTGGVTRHAAQPPDVQLVLRPPEWKWSHTTIRRPARKAWTAPGGATSTRTVSVVNSAGEQFDPLPEEEVPVRVLDYSRHASYFDKKETAVYLMSFNSDRFLDYEPGEVQCVRYDGEPVYQNDTLIGFRETLQFLCVDTDWTGLTLHPVQLLDAGWRKKEPGKSRTVEIRDEITNNPITQPWPLNGSGNALTIASVEAGSLVYRDFYVYKQRSFAPLGITGI